MTMAPAYDPDTIRILVSSDNHVGYEERDPIRKDDSWRTFDEVMNLAREHDVDMVLLGGDLFHDNKPSRKALYQVMRSLRKNCLGMKPCALEFLSDALEVFGGAFPQVNYEDPDMNIAIPVFSIHGNHDDPSGDGHLCSLDLLQVSGLVNYFGRVPEADNIEAKPVLLRKGSTKLALYGLSNVRDERMFRTFRDQKIKWFRPNDSGDGDGPPRRHDRGWFNLLTVHQNHHAHTATSYLPESVLPDWMDLVVWGHEHECLMDPKANPDTGFHVMQPGSSVATSLVPGEAVAKHAAIVSVTGRQFKVEKLPLRSVRPFVTREIVLASEPRFRGLDKKKDNRIEVTRILMEIVDEMIEEAISQWRDIQDTANASSQNNHYQSHTLDDENDLGENGSSTDAPLPLIRLKVEYSAPEGGQFECENPQRFSNRFVGRVANVNDVVYFYRKKKLTSSHRQGDATLPTGMSARRRGQGQGAGDEDGGEDEEEEGPSINVDKLVQEFLAAQSLKILPQAPFGDAVNEFVTKDDKHAMEYFVSQSLAGQVQQMLTLDSDEEDLESAMEAYRVQLESQFKESAQSAAAAATAQTGRRRPTMKPRPDGWDSDRDGHWEDQPGVFQMDDSSSSSVTFPGILSSASPRDSTPMAATARKSRAKPASSTRGTTTATARGRGRGRGARATATATAAKGRASRARPAFDDGEEEEEEADITLLDDDDDDGEDDDVIMDEAPKTTSRSRKAATTKVTATSTRSRKKPAGNAAPPAPAPDPARSQPRRKAAPAIVVSDDVDDDDDDGDDDDDAFEAAPSRRR